jgi:hypothetical protein
VLDWIRRLRKVSQKLTLPSRDASAGRSQIQLNPAKLTPSPEIYLSQLAALTQVMGEQLDRQSGDSSDKSIANRLHEFSNRCYAAHASLTELLSKSGAGATKKQGIFEGRLQTMLERIQGTDLYEDLMLDYIAFVMLKDNYRKLAKGLTPAKRLKVEELIDSLAFEEPLYKIIFSAIEADSKLGHRLAMYGRMIVADVLLEIRDSVSLDKVAQIPNDLDASERARAQFKALEPYSSELIAQHTVRMDRLGLTA